MNSNTMNKVIWSEGMLLKPQQFQQMDRYVEWSMGMHLHDRYETPWGVKSLKLATHFFPLMRLGLTEGSGIFPDGTPFFIEEGSTYPPVIEIPVDTCDMNIYLGLPLEKTGAPTVDMHPRGTELGARFVAKRQPVHDNTTTNNELTAINVGALKLQLLLESDDRSQFTCIQIARIKQVTDEKGILLDDAFIPPTLDCQADPKLASLVYEVYALLFQRARVLVQRVAKPNRNTPSDISDFLMLQLINREKPLFAHFTKTTGLHPKIFYQHCVQLMSELATFNHVNKQITEWPEYDHSNLSCTLMPIMVQLREFLNKILEHAAIDVPLVQNNLGVYVAAVHDVGLVQNSDFILAVRTTMADNKWHELFLAQVKIAPIDQIQSLVNSQVSGIGLNALSVAPPQIPYHTGFTYYILDKTHALWQQAKCAGGLAFHIGGEFSELELELWAIKGEH